MNNISLIRGDTLQLVIPEITYADSGAEYVLTDTDKVIMEIKKHSYDKSHIIRKELTKADVVDGQIQIVIYPSETADIEVGKYVFDVRLVQDEQHIFTIVPYSEFDVLKNVTDIER